MSWLYGTPYNKVVFVGDLVGERRHFHADLPRSGTKKVVVPRIMEGQLLTELEISSGIRIKLVSRYLR